jgi:hypothetical protein
MKRRLWVSLLLMFGLQLVFGVRNAASQEKDNSPATLSPSDFLWQHTPERGEVANLFHFRYIAKEGPFAEQPASMQEIVDACDLAEYLDRHSGEEIVGLSLKNADITHLRKLSRVKNSLKYLGLYFLKTDDLSPLSDLKRLEYLHLLYPPATNIANYPASANADNQSGPEDLSSLKSLSKLRALHIQDADNLTEISALSQLPKLEHLSISLCSKIQSFEVISQLDHLIFLELGAMQQLKNVDFLRKCKGLKMLRLSQLLELENLQGMEGAEELRSLFLMSCRKIEHLPPSDNLEKMEWIEIHDTPIARESFERFLETHPRCYYRYYRTIPKGAEPLEFKK